MYQKEKKISFFDSFEMDSSPLLPLLVEWNFAREMKWDFSSSSLTHPGEDTHT